MLQRGTERGAEDCGVHAIWARNGAAGGQKSEVIGDGSDKGCAVVLRCELCAWFQFLHRHTSRQKYYHIASRLFLHLIFI